MEPRRTVAIILLAILFSTMPGLHPALAQEDKTIVMFVPDTDWPPYLIDDPKYPGGGVLVDVFTSIAEPMGYTVIPKRLPNQRGWLLLKKGEVDVHAKAWEWVKHPEDYLWTDVFLLHVDTLLYPVGNQISYTCPEDLYGKTVTCIKGFIYPVMEPHFGHGKIKRLDVTSPYAMLDLLSLGRADAALVNRHETLWLFQNHPELEPHRFKLEENPFDSAGYRYVFTKDDKWKPFIEQFDMELDAMKKDGRLEAILARYR